MDTVYSRGYVGKCFSAVLASVALPSVVGTVSNHHAAGAMGQWYPLAKRLFLISSIMLARFCPVSELSPSRKEITSLFSSDESFKSS